MKDMISKIIKMDEEARKITEELKSGIKKSEDEVKEYREKIESEYLERARKRIEKNRITEQEVSDNQLQEIRKNHENLLKCLEKKSEENLNIWVQKITERVVGE